MLKGTNKNKYVKHNKSQGPIAKTHYPWRVTGLLSSALGYWILLSPHCFNIAAITLHTEKSLLFLCSSGWQGHNLFYDLLGRVAVVYSSLKNTFNNQSSETLLKTQDHVPSFRLVLTWWYHRHRSHPTVTRRALSIPWRTASLRTALSFLQRTNNHAKGSSGHRKTAGSWMSGAWVSCYSGVTLDRCLSCCPHLQRSQLALMALWSPQESTLP